MEAGDVQRGKEPDEGPRADDGAARLTLTLSPEALGALGDYVRSGGVRGLAFERPLLEAIAVLPPRRDARGRTVLSRSTLRKVHEFVEANLHRDIHVADIARAAFLSAHHLGHSYREATGQSLWQYVLRRRTERARVLIDAQPEATLADIALQCGFDAYSQFIAAFRKVHGVTPGTYRRTRERLGA